MSASWRQALDAQMGVWRFLNTDAGARLLRGQWELEAKNLNRETRAMLRQLFESEPARILSADPIFVSAEMCELVEAAADPTIDEPFRPEPLYVTDLVTPCGFMFFEKPFDVPDRFDRPVKIAAMSYSPMIAAEDIDLNAEDDPVRGIKHYDAEEVMRLWSGAEGVGAMNGSGIAISLYDEFAAEDAKAIYDETGTLPPSLSLMHVTPWYFGMSFDGNDVDENGVGAEWWWRIIQVMFRLMQQRIATQERWTSERHQRKEAARLGLPVRETLVVRLRRAASREHSDEHGDANYSHRFIVGGHWRNQWYPKSEEHRQIWISSYVKGDETLPLVIKPRRAMVWAR